MHFLVKRKELNTSVTQKRLITLNFIKLC